MTSTDYLEDRLARLELTLNPTSSQLRVSSPSFSECSSGSTEYFSSTSDDGARNSEYGSPLVEGTSESQHSGQNQVSQPRPSERIYSYSSPTRSGVTNRWAEAANATVGIPHAQSHKLSSYHHKAKSASRGDEVQLITSGSGGNIFQGYPTLQAARAAFEYAESQTWRGVTTANSVAPGATISPSQRPIPISHNSGPIKTTPLHCGVWYIVYKGISPGVYQSHLECAINTTGISGSTFDSTRNLDQARNLFRIAKENHEICVLLPSHYQ
ncbi:hypothetical protein C8R43DRAFT_966270 [Mycena crocata]|nr:hypothetical protein C8R43DRAFT_966270 [Mycena crocata]